MKFIIPVNAFLDDEKYLDEKISRVWMCNVHFALLQTTKINVCNYYEKY